MKESDLFNTGVIECEKGSAVLSMIIIHSIF